MTLCETSSVCTLPANKIRNKNSRIKQQQQQQQQRKIKKTYQLEETQDKA
jgi:hypothetical protein